MPTSYNSNSRSGRIEAMLRAETPPSLAVLPSPDHESWRGARLGLDCMCRAVQTVLWLLLLQFIVVLPVALVAEFSQTHWLTGILLLADGVVWLGCVLTFMAGMGLCCTAPALSGARGHAQAAFVLTLTTCGLTLIGGVVALFAWQWIDWLKHQTELQHLESVYWGMVALSFVLAVASWNWFVGDLAAIFAGKQLAELASSFATLFRVWVASCTVAIAAMGLVPDLIERPVLLFFAIPIATYAIVSCPVLALWALALIFETRGVVRQGTEPVALDFRRPIADSHSVLVRMSFHDE